jgi:phosphoenolpyruvate synthase/pyruvate phosphate dikinase
MKEFEEGEVLVTKMTDPDWNSIMVKASQLLPMKEERHVIAQLFQEN